MTAFEELENTILKLLWKHKTSHTTKELLNEPSQMEPWQWLPSVHTSELSDPGTVLAQSQTGGSVSLPHTRSSLQRHKGSMYLRTYNNPFSFFCCGERTLGAGAAWGEKAHTSGLAPSMGGSSWQEPEAENVDECCFLAMGVYWDSFLIQPRPWVPPTVGWDLL